MPNAISALEQAVELSPQDAGYRKTLAELYLKCGGSSPPKPLMATW
jgi:hypothetical protein